MNAAGKKIDKKAFVNKYKSKLFKSISNEFKASWEAIGIGNSIAILEEAKLKSVDGVIRPSKETPKEHVNYHHQCQLIKKKSFYEKQLQFQGPKLEVNLINFEMKQLNTTITFIKFFTEKNSGNSRNA